MSGNERKPSVPRLRFPEFCDDQPWSFQPLGYRLFEMLLMMPRFTIAGFELNRSRKAGEFDATFR